MNIFYYFEKILNVIFNLYICIFMRFLEMIDDLICELDLEKFKGYFLILFFLFCFEVLNVYF